MSKKTVPNHRKQNTKFILLKFNVIKTELQIKFNNPEISNFLKPDFQSHKHILRYFLQQNTSHILKIGKSMQISKII